MKDTKEQILQVSLELFANRGYDSVSVSQIAGALGMVKSALYRHYPNKQAIWNSILARMEALDAQTAADYHLPQTTEVHAQTRLSDLRQFTLEMFDHWTQEAFSSQFRRMLTIEQYHSQEMAQLYRQYLSQGPLAYVEELFAPIAGDSANTLALGYYSPMYLFYSLYDTEEDKSAVRQMLAAHIDRFLREVAAQYHWEEP